MRLHFEEILSGTHLNLFFYFPLKIKSNQKSLGELGRKRASKLKRFDFTFVNLMLCEVNKFGVFVDECFE